MSLKVRPFRPSDAERLRVICHETAAERPFLPYVEDPRLASAFYLDPYLELEPASCLVAELEGRVIAYLAGTRDTLQFRKDLERYLLRHLPRILATHADGVIRRHYRHRVSHRVLLRKYVRIIRRADSTGGGVDPHLDLRRYPAHCHLQVASEGRSQRAGRNLMLHFHELLRAAGVPGQHSDVVEEVGRESYSRMIQSLGFRVVHERTFTRRERPTLLDAGTWTERILVREL